jgi:hypothetical protein
MTIDSAIRIFADFLNASWASTTQLLINRPYTSNGDSINDWLQANWEFLIERKVLKVDEYLEFYGDGADFNGASSRITDPDSLPTFKINLMPKNGNSVHDLLNLEDASLDNSAFEKLVGFRDGFYILEPEFDFVLLTDQNMGIERVVRLIDIDFVLERC